MFALRPCIPVDDVDHVPKDGRPPTLEELHQFFLPFRGFCARKGIEAKELVLHDIDVPSALTDYVIKNSISNIVVGDSHWNALIRRFRNADVPTSLAKSLPKSCILYVISKGKMQNIRPTGQPQNIDVTTTKSIRELVTILQNSPLVQTNNGTPDAPDSEDVNRKDNGWVSLHEPKGAILRKSNKDLYSPTLSVESSTSQSSSNESTPNNSDSSGKLGSQLIDKSQSPSKPPISLEKSIRKLKLELKKTMEQYNLVSREAVLARERAMELEKYMQEKERDVEKARLAEEAALALAEVEKQKTKAAIESAEMSRCLAAIEIKKRKQTEKRAMQKEEEKQIALNTNQPDNILCKRYNIKEIEDATNCFDKALKLGEGGYGPVFKGVLDNTVVAIKALRSNITQGDRQFQQEVDVLTTVRHPNMVLLLGVCPENGCLVYEFTENGTLEDRLFQKDNTPPLPWNLRFKIASEIATGLLFLHQTKPEPIVHRDLKPSNILLTKNYVTKIADVGLARLVPPSAADKTTQYHMTATAGTFFYIDPEYQQTGLLGVKSDIYSLGVVLLQIITGKGPMGVARLVEEAIHEGKFEEVLDPNVKDWPVEETLSLASLALKCCEMRKRDRPDLGSVILPELNRLSDLGGVLDTDIVTASRNHF